MDEHFIYIVLEIVSEIPKGSVATYKQIAELAGRERMPGRLARFSPHPPCMANTRAIASLTVQAERLRTGMNRKIFS